MAARARVNPQTFRYYERRPLRIESLCDTGQGGVAARLTGLPAEVRQLHREILRTFLTSGQTPHRDNLPLAGGIGRDEAFRQLSELHLMYLDSDGHVMVAYPLSGRPTGIPCNRTRALVRAMCAIDALGIPLITGRDVVIVSADPCDGHPIRIERRGEIWRWAPQGTAVLAAQSSGCGPAATCLCPAITFHTSRRRAEDYLRRRAELIGWVLDEVQAVEVARRRSVRSSNQTSRPRYHSHPHRRDDRRSAARLRPELPPVPRPNGMRGAPPPDEWVLALLHLNPAHHPDR